MRRLLLVAFAATAIGCKMSSEPLTLATTDADVTGAFGLQLAAGNSLPLLAGQTATQEVDLVADTMAIVKDSTWTETSYYVLVAYADGTQTTAQTASSGTYLVNAGQINFTMLVGGTATFTGSVSGKALTLIYNNVKYIYSR